MNYLLVAILLLLLIFGVSKLSKAQKPGIMEIKPSNFEWIDGTDGVKDLCAHGHLFLRIGKTILSDTDDGQWTLSAAALNLLRSLKPDYDGPDDFVIPCCGIPYYFGDKVVLSGCNKGIHWEIKHEGNKVLHVLENGEQVTMNLSDYKKIVFAFADEVENFYKNSKPKDLGNKNESEAYNAMWQEWHELRSSEAGS